jgi:ribosome maturation factor RimP
MLDKSLLTSTVEDAIQGTDLFLVDVQVSPDNNIVVEIDSPKGVDIDTCCDLSRRIHEVFDNDVEDYELEVGSAGLTSPFKVIGQYLKNIGNDVEVLTKDGRKLHGTLTLVDADARKFTIEVATKVKEPGAKRPSIVNQPVELDMDGCKSVKYLIQFK